MKTPVDVYSDQDKRDIRDCARRVAGATAKAIAIHRAYLRTHGVRHGDPYFDFMSEVDNPCPDLLLRSRYREAILNQRGRKRTMSKRIEFVFGDLAMTFSPEDIEAVLNDWQTKNPGRSLEQMDKDEFTSACMERIKASARPTRTVIHN